MSDNYFEFDNFDFSNLDLGNFDPGNFDPDDFDFNPNDFDFGDLPSTSFFDLDWFLGFYPEIQNNDGDHVNKVSVNENTRFVVDIETHDNEGTEENGQLTYSISGGADRNLFEVNARTGEVFFKQAPDFENPQDKGRNNRYEVEVKVTDAAGNDDEQLQIITVKDVVENSAPVITSNGGGDTTFVRVNENTTFVTNVETRDDFSSEARGTLTYTITSGDDQNLFTINQRTGELAFRTAPDFENPVGPGNDNLYNLHVTVTDEGGLTDTQTINIGINDVNEQPVNQAPVITSNGGGNSAFVRVDENTRFVTNVETRDDFSSEAQGTLTYAITSGDDQDLFTINQRTGELQFRTAPDFENPVGSGNDNFYSLHVTVTDEGGLQDTQTINIGVNDVNEQPANSAPVITSNGGGNNATIRVNENNRFVTNVEARDDFSSEAQGTLTYSISSGNDQNLFTINQRTGELQFRNAPDFENPLDAGRNNIYNLHVTVTDEGGLQDTQSLSVVVDDVNEQPVNTAPVIISDGGGNSAVVGINENTTFVTNVETRDDFSSEAQGTLTYAIQGGSDQRLFTIDPRSGELSFRSAPDFENPLDANGDNRYNVRVVVTDEAGLSDRQTISVRIGDVNEQPVNTAPVITSNGGREDAVVRVDENDRFVTNVEARDDFSSEAQGTLSYTLTGGSDRNLFTIDPNSGVLSFRNAPDFENPLDVGRDNGYDVQVTVTDEGGLSDRQDLHVIVDNVNEQPVNTAPVIISDGGGNSAVVGINENTTFVTNVETRDDFSSEAQGTLTYAIQGGSDQRLFAIDPTSGALSFRNAPDFENPIDANSDNRYNVRVVVTDEGGLSDRQTIGVRVGNVNEQPVNTAPVITSNGGGNSAVVGINENTTFVTDVETRDDFSAEAQGTITYAIQGGSDQRLFTIDQATGELSFRTAPDFENPTDANGDNRYNVRVVATDEGGLSDRQNISVRVGNVNEQPSNNAPVITSNGGGRNAIARVDENTRFVTNVETRDDFSSEAQGTLSYTITGGSDRTLFTVDQRTGVLSFRTAPDFENPADTGRDNGYDVQVTVTDEGGLSDRQDLHVIIDDVNEQSVNTAPVITSNGGGTTATVGINENTTFVTNVEARDDFSSEAQGTLTYRLLGGSDRSLFVIDQNTGELSFRTAPDFENPTDFGRNNNYRVRVGVTDEGGLSDQQTIGVNIRNVNEDGGGGGLNMIRGTAGDDVIYGTAGADKIEGLGGSDRLKGLGGDDQLFGGFGNDILGGGLGNDTISGVGNGSRGVGEIDRLDGGAGRDTFLLGDGSGSFYIGEGFKDLAIITNFTAGEDNLVLFGSASDYSLISSGNGTTIAHGINNGLEAIASLKKVAASDIDLNDFTFVQ